MRPAGPAGPVGPFIPETSNSHSYAVKEHAVSQNLLQEWPKQAVTVSEGFHLKCWLNTWEYPVKYLGILERLEPRGHPSFHSDLADQDPPEEKSLMLFPHLSSSREPEQNRWLGTAQHIGAVSERLHRQLQLPWEYSSDTLPKYWGITKEKTGC